MVLDVSVATVVVTVVVAVVVIVDVAAVVLALVPPVCCSCLVGVSVAVVLTVVQFAWLL